MNRLILFLLFFNVHTIAFGQNCKCDSTFQIVIYHIETNYAGWFDKIKHFDKTEFLEMTNQVALNTKAISIDSLCYKEIKKYVSYFQDGHLHLNLRRPELHTTNNNKPIVIEKTEMSETEMLVYFKSIKQLDKVEGIWENDNYKIGIVKSKTIPNTFNGIIISSKNENWIAGEVKLYVEKNKSNSYKLKFINGDKTETIENNIVFFKNILDGKDLTLSRVYPISNDPISIDDYMLETDPSNPKLSFPKNDLAVWTFPNFYPQNMDVVKILLEKHKAKLETTKKWIIDLRGNEGGDVRVGNLLLPFLYTKPIVWSNEFSRLTEDNFNKWYNTYVKDYYETLSKEEQQQLDSVFAVTKTHFGQFGNWDNENKIADTITFEMKMKVPEKIVLLIDKNTFSSGELFTILARQSDKVIVMGEKSAGSIDYGNILTYKTNCSDISLSLPSSRNNWLDQGFSVDRDKVQPD
ncbi:MAG: S41 family peptidase, partial [Saprospiraceae bacterium]